MSQTPQGNLTGGLTPNLFVFEHHGLHITYSATSVSGRPLFTYKQGPQEKQFSNDEIHVEESVLGTLVTVYIKSTVDTGATSLTLILPRVNLANAQHQEISALAIEVEHKSGQLPTVGNMDIYHNVYHLRGSASFVEF